MKWTLLMTLAVIAAGCASRTAAGPGPGAINAERAAAPGARPRAVVEADVEATEPPSDQPSVVIVATSPRNEELLPNAQDVLVPLRRARPPAATKRRARIMDGMLIGAAIGIVGGALLGAQRDEAVKQDPDAVRCDACYLIGDSAVFGAIGLGLGAAAAGIVATFDIP